MRLFCALTLFLFVSSCSTLRGRLLVDAAIGAAVLGGAATYFSPNSESQGINGLVFGLVGAVAGGAFALLTAPDNTIPPSKSSLQQKELSHQIGANPELYPVPVNSDLPDFVKQRLQPAVIEVINEPDTISDDGTLHAPHKIYRIQRNAELYANPLVKSQKDGEK